MMIALIAASAVLNLLDNPGFEVAEGVSGAVSWQLNGAVFSRTPGAGRNGTCALKWTAPTNVTPRRATFQKVPVKPGRLYRLDAYARCEGIVAGGHGASVGIDWCDAKGKWIAGEYPMGVKGDEKDWQHITATAPRMPTNAAYASVMFWVENGKAGTAYFDDIRFAEIAPEPVPAFLSDCYRDTAWEGDVTFAASIDPAAAGMSAADVRGTFSVTGVDGKRHLYRVDDLGGGRVTVTLPVSQLALGRQTVAFRLTDPAGARKGDAAMTFTRLDRDPCWRVRFDKHGRTYVDGKPFFPLGFYNGGLSSNQVRLFWRGTPFNCVMPYSLPAPKEIDFAWTNGIMSFVSLKDAYVRTMHCPKEIKTEADEIGFVRRAVERYAGKPGLLGWYVNDEMDVGMVPRMAARRSMLEAADPNHPTWGCIYQIVEAGAYVPTVDVHGSDPYPVPGDIGYVTTATRAVVNASLGMRPAWQTLQIFDWSAYHNPPRPGERAPTEEEVRNMTWQAIASGANGIMYYSYPALMKMRKKDPFERRWAECCRVAGEVREKFPVLLAEPSSRRVHDAPDAIVWRAWTLAGETWLLAVNRTRKPVAAELAFDGAGVIRVDLPALGHEFRRFDERKEDAK